MKRTAASQTSSMVAMLRAAADAGLTHVPGFSDPTAKHLLDGPWLRRLERVRKRSRHKMFAEAIKNAADLLTLRTLVIDEAVKAAVGAGVRQLVILGAGLDGRAYRLRELTSTNVYEVDHPATQALKRERAQALTPIAQTLTFVPVDFERDVLGAALEAAGHSASEPTAWIWEGVVMYLTSDAMRTTLRTLEQRSAKGSTLIIQYNMPRRRNLFMRLILRWWGEPSISAYTPEQMARELTAFGFTPREDTESNAWAPRFHADGARRFRGGVRIVTATR
jgi:methyltransferase (TIGR00027 family)